jgi:hypothetical protein
MDRQVLLRKIMSAGDEVRRLQQDLIALQSIDIVDYPENYSNLSRQAALRGETVARKLRGLVYSTTNISKTEYLESAADSIGICVKSRAFGIVEITIPGLIPHRRKKQSSLITEPLFAALSRFVTGHPPEAPFERFGQCVICITHFYDKSLFGKARSRDHDNVDTKGIIDVINTFLMSDDSGNLCDIYNSGELSDEDFTRISIVKKDIFPYWVLGHKNLS